MNAVSIAVALAYLLAAAGFVVALHLMNSPATARRGSRLSWLGMIVAVAAALVSVIHDATITTTGWIVLIAGAAGGGAVGLIMARRVKMTDVPQVVSIFNAVGGGAAALVAIGNFVRLSGGPGISSRGMIATVLDIIIGPVTFSGSLIAAGKLQGWVSSRPVVFPGARLITAALTVIGVGASCYLLAGHDSIAILILVVCAALAFGITMTMPIGGADMPVVVALLNSFTGIAVAIAGFVIDNGGLIIGGALVGASGGILTVLMAQAMSSVRIPPDAPTSAPPMIRAPLPITKPAMATAMPVKEFSSAMTTGMSAPPIGIVIVTPKPRAAQATRISTGMESWPASR